MKLNEYLTLKDGKVQRTGAECIRIAKKADTSPGYVYLIALGHKSPSLRLAQRIATATRGSVGVADWPQSKSKRRAA